jgi:dihydrofolate reductase
VATSLDGYIAGPQGEIDWIVSDPAVDFAAIYTQFDTVLLGRQTYELTQQPGVPAWPRGWRVFVFSRSLKPADHPSVTIVTDDVRRTVATLRAEAGRDIWLFGGGQLFSSLISLHLVDAIELAVMPVLLGSGIPLADALAQPARLTLTHADSSPTGIVNLRYKVTDAAG